MEHNLHDYDRYAPLEGSPQVAHDSSDFRSTVVFPSDTKHVELTPAQCQLLHDALFNHITELDGLLADGDDVMSDIYDALAALQLVGHDMTDEDCPRTLAYVRRALENGGYTGDSVEDITESHYVGMTSSGKEQHAIKYYDPDEDEYDNVGHGYVYVWKRDGNIIGDF